MSTATSYLPAGDVDSYDYLIVGGGTAGCVIASRLAEYLPNKRILLIEAGPSDFMDDRVLKLKDWLNLLGGELDYDYPTTEQPMGMYALYFICQRSIEADNFFHFSLLQETAISAIRVPRCSGAAPVTTRSSPSAHSNMIAAGGKNSAARAGPLIP